MVGIDLMHQQRLFVRNLKQQGILDNHFDQVLEIRTIDNPRFVLEVISMFLNDADNCVSELNRLLNEAVVDYTQVVNYCHQLRGSSARCLVAFDKLKDEYQNLKNNFNIITQIERTIVANHTRRRNVRP
eukprot:XP_015580799.1 histidine-containing phosphotransfer protein 1 isoform X2 [Ricinus communis]